MAFNRSLAVKSQWRDRKGRWVEMGRGVRFYNSATGKYEIGTFTGPDSNGNARIKLPNGTYVTAPQSAVEAYSIKGRLRDAGKKVRDKVKATLKGKDTKPFNPFADSQFSIPIKPNNVGKKKDLIPGERFIPLENGQLPKNGDIHIAHPDLNEVKNKWHSPVFKNENDKLDHMEALIEHMESEGADPSKSSVPRLFMRESGDENAPWTPEYLPMDYKDPEYRYTAEETKALDDDSEVYTPDSEDLEAIAEADHGNLSENVKADLDSEEYFSNDDNSPLKGATYNEDGDLVLNNDKRATTKNGNLKAGDTFYIPKDRDYGKGSNVLLTEEDGIPATALVTDVDDSDHVNPTVTFIDDQEKEHSMGIIQMNVTPQNIDAEDRAFADGTLKGGEDQKANISSESETTADEDAEPFDSDLETDMPSPYLTAQGTHGKSNPHRISNDSLPKDTPEVNQPAPTPTPVQQDQKSPLDDFPDIKRNTPEALPGEKFAPTQEQQDIIDSVLSGKDVRVQALAGAGKTSTLEALSRRIQKDEPDSQAIYIAFNKSVQTEAEERMPSNVEPRTGHSLAHAWARKDKQGKNILDKLGGAKGKKKEVLKKNSDISNHLGIQPLKATNDSQYNENTESSRTKTSVTSGVIETVKNYQTSSDDNIGTQHLPERLGSLSPEHKQEIVDYANKYWQDALSANGKVPVQHDTYRKAWALSKPDLTDPSNGGGKKKANILYIDEAQDTPPVLAKVVADQKMRKVVVGDANQAIYGFTGAKDYLSEAEADLELPLTQSFRFGPQVADAGNRFLQLLGAKNRVVGGGPESKITPDMQDPDAILVRSNRGLISEALSEMSKGKKITVPSGTKSNIQSLIDTSLYLKGSMKKKPYNLHEDLEAYNSWDEVLQEVDQTGNTGLKNLSNLIDQMEVDGETGISALWNLRKKMGGIKEKNSLVDNVELQRENGKLTFKDKGGKKNYNSPTEAIIKDMAKSNGAYAQYNKGQWAQYMDEMDKQGGLQSRGWTKTDQGWEFSGSDSELDQELEAVKFDLLAEGDVTISTAHKSKGLEWDRVKIGDDFGAPEYNEETEEMEFPSKDELMLDYVSVTRAKKELDPGGLAWIYDFTDDNGGAPSVDTPDFSDDEKNDLADEILPPGDLDTTEDVDLLHLEEEDDDSESEDEEQEEDSTTPDTSTEEEEEEEDEEQEEEPVENNPDSKQKQDQDLQKGDKVHDFEGEEYDFYDYTLGGEVVAVDEDGNYRVFDKENLEETKSNPDSRQRHLNEPPKDDDDEKSAPGLEGPPAPPAPAEPPVPGLIPGDINPPGEGGPSTPDAPSDVVPDAPTEDLDTPSTDTPSSPSQGPDGPSAPTPEAEDSESLPEGPGSFQENESNLPDVDSLQEISGEHYGSNPGGYYKDPETGREFYVKQAKTENHASNEALASSFYSEAGIPNAEQHKVQFSNGKYGTMSEIVPGAEADLGSHLNDEDYLKKIRDGFAMDAFLENWDVVGLEYDNVISDENGDPVRVDPGGALMFRAQGAPKGGAFSDSADSWDSLRDYNKNSKSASIFSDITDQEMFDSAKHVAGITPERIDELVDAQFGEDSPMGDELKSKLKNRRQDIINRANALGLGDVTQSDSETTAEPISEEQPAISEFQGSKYDKMAEGLPSGFVLEPGYEDSGYTDEALDAISNYMLSPSDYNNALRGTETPSAQTDSRIVHMKTLMKPLSESKSVHRVWRGISGNPDSDRRAEMFKAFDTPGGIVMDGGFMSTSLDENVAKAFSELDNPLDKTEYFASDPNLPAKVMLDIDTSRVKGHEINYGYLDEQGFEDAMAFSEEQEVLLDTDTVLVVDSTERAFEEDDQEYISAKVRAYPKSALYDGTIQKDYPDMGLPELEDPNAQEGDESNGQAGEEAGDTEGDSGVEGPTGEGPGYDDSSPSAEEPSLIPAGHLTPEDAAKDVLFTDDGAVYKLHYDNPEGIKYLHKTADNEWDLYGENGEYIDFETTMGVRSLLNDQAKADNPGDSVSDHYLQDTPFDEWFSETENNDPASQYDEGDVVTLEDDTHVQIYDKDDEDGSYVGEVVDEQGNPVEGEAPQQFDDADIDHKGITGEDDDSTETPSESESESSDTPTEDTISVEEISSALLQNDENYEPKPKGSTKGSIEFDDEGNPLDVNGESIVPGKKVKLFKANGDLWFEGTVHSIGADPSRVKITDSATGKTSIRRPNKIFVQTEDSDSTETAPQLPPKPYKTEQKVNDSLINLPDGTEINVHNSDENFTKNTNDQGDPIFTKEGSDQAIDIEELVETQSEKKTEGGVAYSDLEYTPESNQVSEKSQEDGEKPSYLPENMGVDADGFQYIVNPSGEKLYVGSVVANKKGEIIGTVESFDGGKLLGKRLKIRRKSDNTFTYRQPNMLKLYNEQNQMLEEAMHHEGPAHKKGDLITGEQEMQDLLNSTTAGQALTLTFDNGSTWIIGKDGPVWGDFFEMDENGDEVPLDGDSINSSQLQHFTDYLVNVVEGKKNEAPTLEYLVDNNPVGGSSIESIEYHGASFETTKNLKKDIKEAQTPEVKEYEYATEMKEVTDSKDIKVKSLPAGSQIVMGEGSFKTTYDLISKTGNGKWEVTHADGKNDYVLHNTVEKDIKDALLGDEPVSFREGNGSPKPLNGENNTEVKEAAESGGFKNVKQYVDSIIQDKNSKLYQQKVQQEKDAEQAMYDEQAQNRKNAEKMFHDVEPGTTITFLLATPTGKPKKGALPNTYTKKDDGGWKYYAELPFNQSVEQDHPNTEEALHSVYGHMGSFLTDSIGAGKHIYTVKTADGEDITGSFPIPEETPDSPVEGGTFQILTPEQQGASGDGYHESGPWGKFGASGMMIQSVDPQTGEKKYLLAQKSHNANNNPGAWYLPGGALNENETAHQGAAREVAEEVGLTQDNLNTLTPQGETVFDNGKGWTYTNIAVTSPEMFDAKPADDESNAMQWFTEDELKNMKGSGELLPSFEKGLDDLLDKFHPSDSEPAIEKIDDSSAGEGLDADTDQPTDTIDWLQKLINDTPKTTPEPEATQPEEVEGVDFVYGKDGSTIKFGESVNWPSQKKTGLVVAIHNSDKVMVDFDGALKNLNPKKKLVGMKSEEKDLGIPGEQPQPPDTADLDSQIEALETQTQPTYDSDAVFADMANMFYNVKEHGSTKDNMEEAHSYKTIGKALVDKKGSHTDLIETADLMHSKKYLSDEMHTQLKKNLQDTLAESEKNKQKIADLQSEKAKIYNQYNKDLHQWKADTGQIVPGQFSEHFVPVSTGEQVSDNPTTWGQSIANTSNLDSALKSMSADKVSGANGVSIMLDSDQVSMGEMRVNKLTDSKGVEKNLSTFQLTGASTDEIYDAFVKKFGSQLETGKYKVKDAKRQSDGTILESDITFHTFYDDSESSTLHLPDGTEIKISRGSKSSPFTTFTQRSVWDGRVEIRTPADGGSASIQNALDQLGLKKPAPSSKEDVRRMAAVSLYHQINGIPEDHKSDSPTDDVLNKFLKSVEKSHGITLDDMQISRDNLGFNQFMLTKEGYEKLQKKYDNLPTHYTHSFYSGSPVQVLSSNLPGIVATGKRWFSGIQSHGMSPSTDMETGGATQVFLRPRRDDKSKNQLYLRPDVINRMLGGSYDNSDKYGRYRKGLKKWQAMNNNKEFSGTAESNYLNGLDISSFWYYKTMSEEARKDIIDKLKSKGTYEINGIPVDQFIIGPDGTPPQLGDLVDYSGDYNATPIGQGGFGGI